MWLITVIDDGDDPKLLEIEEESHARNILLALVTNGQMAKLEEG